MAWAAPHCLACLGCPRCGAHQLWETIEEDDGGLFHHPLRFAGRVIRGDWRCLVCGEGLVYWAEYRRRLRSWLAGRAAMAPVAPDRYGVRGVDGKFSKDAAA